MAKKKQKSNPLAWVLLGLMAFGGYQYWIAGDEERAEPSVPRSSTATRPSQPDSAPAPLNVPRFVNVASLNVRHTPSTSGPLVTTLPRGTPLRVIGREGGWLLIDLSPTLEGWVSEDLTTTRGPKPTYLPPAALAGSR